MVLKEQSKELETEALTVGFKGSWKGGVPVLSGVNVTLRKGELVCLIGPNGTGKSTLLRTLAGVHPPLAGQVFLQGKDLGGMGPPEVAKSVSIVLTERVGGAGLTVYDIVAMGRYPYTDRWGLLSDMDREFVEKALERVGMGALAHRQLHEVSDGERQKAMIAKALAQDTPFMFLDEPTAHLDLPNRVALLALLRKLSADTGKSILVATHELDLALQVADSLWLIGEEGHIHTGLAEEMVLQGHLQHLFEGEGVSFDPSSGTFRMLYQEGTKKVGVKGGGWIGEWTGRFLRKNGYTLVEDESGMALVEVDQAGPAWVVVKNGERIPAKGLMEVLEALEPRV